MKKIAIMQPYFFPYLGYFQLINSVDEFIVYDNIQYTKKGWINRNRILFNDSDRVITLPLKKASDYLNIIDRQLSDNWKDDRKKMLNLIHLSYAKAPCFKETYALVEKCLLHEDVNLFNFLLNSLKGINNHLGIQTPVIISSGLGIDHSLTGQDKVISICKNQNALVYINAIGGKELYRGDEFQEHDIRLNFIQSEFITYEQFGRNYLPWLSIIDVMMFNSSQTVKKFLNKYALID
ncbi:MAG: hypothetical protein CMI54_05780 [Parcubacteria group bacterium]|nr:hypothetical protein [Parcubacteria group bacterium]|tara:strand:- start:4510 stop:5217 length:708 start_codon:yes stop_codon:yes gene_type:complete